MPPSQNCLIASGPIATGEPPGTKMASSMYMAGNAAVFGVLNAFSHCWLETSIAVRRSSALADEPHIRSGRSNAKINDFALIFLSYCLPMRNEVRITDSGYPMPLVREMSEMRRNSPGEASLSGGDLPPLVGDQGGKADSPCLLIPPSL